MIDKNFKLSNIINTSGCFDLQFRKDTRHERTGSPTYYRWKIQFVVTLPKSLLANLEKIKKALGCGKVSVLANQARFSVQDIDEVFEGVIPHLQKNPPGGIKKKEFELWQKAAQIIHGNKGVFLSKWKKNDLSKLMEIHKSLAKYKPKSRAGKWLEMAKVLTK